MAAHPLNLALRFLLELAALVSFGWWGWRRSGLALAIALPMLAAAVWVVFNVRGDPSRSGSAPVPVRGWLRLTLEGVFFASAAAALHGLGHDAAALGFGAVVLAHYGMSEARIRWLLER